MKSDEWTDVLLPKYFHYHGMNKIKAGKGYRDGHPVGPLSGPCPECDGTIVSVKMNTSRKGFETTAEKVCNKCGLVIPGAFQVLEPKDDYTARPYDTHESWVAAMTPSPKSNEDVAWDAELYEHINGVRMNTKDNVGYGQHDSVTYANENHRNPRLGLAINRLAATPASIKQPMQDWRIKQYHDQADDYINMLQLNKVVAADVHYYIDHNKMYMGRYKADEIIYHLCLVYGHDHLLEENEYNGKLYDLLCTRCTQ